MVDGSTTQADRDSAFEPHYADLAYEITVLMELSQEAVKRGESGPSMLYVACLESTLLHARVLIEFLVGRPAGKGKEGRKKRPASDLGAEQLLPDCDHPANLERLKVDELDEFRYALDGALAHLTKRRIQPDMQIESWVPYINLLIRDLYAFAQALTKAGSSVGPRLEALIAHR